jgi:lipoprotein-releasing system permease protein
MNGFDGVIKQQFFAVMPEATVFAEGTLPKPLDSYRPTLLHTPGVTGAAPFIDAKGMLTFGAQVSGVDVMGIQPSQESTVSAISHKMLEGRLTDLTPGSYHIVLGQTLAASLGAVVGDKVLMITPQVQSSLLGVTPVYRRFTVTGIFQLGAGFGLDAARAYVNYTDAARVFGSAHVDRGFHVQVKQLFQADTVGNALTHHLPSMFMVNTWEQTTGAFFHAVAMEKTMMFMILFLIIAVAAFNLVSTLVMVVKDKQADIAILRTMGASPGLIMRIFLVQGAIVGFCGTILGVGVGLLLAANATAISSGIQHLFHVQLVSPSVYFVNYVPSKIIPMDVVHVTVLALVLSVLAAIYPAWRAFKTQPVEALRYD